MKEMNIVEVCVCIVSGGSSSLCVSGAELVIGTLTTLRPGEGRVFIHCHYFTW